jgi:hypothetical protein
MLLKLIHIRLNQMKKYTAILFVYTFIVICMATFVYLSNPSYQGQYFGLVVISSGITFVVLFFCWCVGATYEALDNWGNS